MPEDCSPAHGVVVLAAGASSRLGCNKLLLMHEHESMVHRAVRLALATDPRDAVVVVGADADTILRELHDLPIRRIDAANWHEGMGTSLRAGLDALSMDCAGALVVVCDQPALDAPHLQALCATWFNAPQNAVASRYALRLGVPAVLPRAWFGDIGAGDRGARALFEGQGTPVSAIANEALAVDIDTPDDLPALRPQG